MDIDHTNRTEVTLFGLPAVVWMILFAAAFWLWHEWYFRFGPGRERDRDEPGDDDDP